MEWQSDWGDGTGRTLLAKGDYDFEVTAAEEGTSKAGNEMIALTVKVFDGQGSHVEIRDWLVATEGGARWIKEFCEAVGLDFTAEKMEPSECLHKTGRAKVRVEEDEYKGSTSERNRIDRYLEQDTEGTTAREALAEPIVAKASRGPRPSAADDDIPF